MFTNVLAGQYNADSTYTYQELNKILEQARINKDQKTLATVYVKLADYEGDVLSDFKTSFKYYRNALEYFKVTGDSTGVHETNQAIARRYYQTGFFDESINILQNLVNIYSNKNEISKLADIYFEINKTADYGKLSKYNPDQMLLISKERGNNIDDPNKKNPLDFVLWVGLNGKPNWKRKRVTKSPNIFFIWHILSKTKDSLVL